jgi:enolase
LKDYNFGVDCAATEFFREGNYELKKTGEIKSYKELMKYYIEMENKFKIASFEDPFAEDDWEAFEEFTKKSHENGFEVVGDDLFVTNTDRIKTGIEKRAASAVLIKLNQIGSVFETVSAIKLAKKAGLKVVVSHRSGETEDSFISDLAYASASDFIKAGSMSRSDRLSKYNRLLEIQKNIL